MSGTAMICAACGEPNPADSRFCGACGDPDLDAGRQQPDPAPPSDVRPPSRTAEFAPDHGLAVVVGSDAACDFRVSDPTVSGRHARVTSLGGGRFRIDDLGSSNGTWVAGRAVPTAEVLESDVVQLGRRPVQMAGIVAALRAARSGGGGRTLVIGREPPADLVLPYPMVSARHLEIRADGKRLAVRDLGSTNGTFVDGQRANNWTTLAPDSTLHVGSHRVPDGTLMGWTSLVHTTASRESATSADVVIPDDGELVLGRDPDCDIPIDAAPVSWHHARVIAREGRWIIKDLGSRNGTFVNGSRVRTAALQVGDRLSLGSVAVELAEGKVVAPRRYVGEVRLDALGLVRVVGDDITILDDVSLSIYPGELVALMGPSGAGKTTLLECLTGQRRPTQGQVLFNGRDLHDDIRSLRDRIGYVPQEDVMHRDLTVFGVLYHAARMRLPGDLPKAAVVDHVDRLITRMGLAHVRDGLIGGETHRGISGGQRKRVNIALELITEPPLLFLDEPTSGLDSTSTLEVMQVLRALADAGKTIIMTIHQPRPEAYALVDSLVLLALGGKLAWFGPAAPDAAAHFAARSPLTLREGANPADYVIDVLDPQDPACRRDPDDWKRDYQASDARRRFVDERLGSPDDTVVIAEPSDDVAPRSGLLSQYLNLLVRYSRRKWRDKPSLAIQLAQAPIVAVLLGWLFFDSELPDPFPIGPYGESLDVLPTGGVFPTLFLLAAAAFWFGCSNVARELVADRPVFRRERMAGLSVLPYLGSVFTLQLVVAATQVAVMVLGAWILVGLEPLSLVPASALLLVTAAAGIGLGLLVSSLAPTEVTAIAVIPLLLLPQLMLAGFLKLFKDMDILQQALTWFVPMRWSFEGLTWTELEAADYPSSIDTIFGFPMIDGLRDGHVLLDGAALAAFAVLFVCLTFVRLVTMRTSS